MFNSAKNTQKQLRAILKIVLINLFVFTPGEIPVPCIEVNSEPKEDDGMQVQTNIGANLEDLVPLSVFTRS